MSKIVNTVRFGNFLFTVVFLLTITDFRLPGQKTGNAQRKIRTVVIDAGHGGKDCGAIGRYSKEKDIVLAIALKAGKYIEEKLPDIEVIYTRTSDVFIPLDERAHIANSNNADLFISIHANSNPDVKAYGTETYAMGLHKTEGNFEVAKKENSVITFEENYETKYEGFDPNDVESYIMFSLIQDIYLDHSLTAASLIQDQFRERAKRKDRGVKQAGFLVLWKTSTPSVLIETGFVSNPREEDYLNSEEGQDYIASAIFRAFRDYKHHIESNIFSTVVAQNEKVKPEEEEILVSDTVVLFNDTTAENIQESVIETEALISSSDIQTLNFEEDTTNKTTDTNVIFKVQIVSSTNQLPPDNSVFKEFNDVDIIKTDSTFKYLVGSKSTYSEVLEYSKWVKSRYPDAFIIAVRNGEIIPLADALKITSETTN